MGPALLQPGERRIKNQQSADDSSLVILMQHKLKHNGGFEQPWNRRPEFGQGIAQWMSRGIRCGIGPVLFKTGSGLIAGEPFCGDVLSRLYGLAG